MCDLKLDLNFTVQLNDDAAAATASAHLQPGNVIYIFVCPAIWLRPLMQIVFIYLSGGCNCIYLVDLRQWRNMMVVDMENQGEKKICQRNVVHQ